MEAHMLKLGKKVPKVDRRTLMLADFLTPQLPIPPDRFSWIPFLDWGMMMNDTVGDCTIAGMGHLIMNWTTYNFSESIPTDEQIITDYTTITGQENNGHGYDPLTGANDNGCFCIDVLNYARQNGIAGHKLDAYAKLHNQNHNQLKTTIELFAGAYCGVWLPLSLQDQLNAGQPWDVPKGGPVGNGAPGSWGGHLIIPVKYGINYVTVVSWGALYDMTWDFYDAYADETYAPFSLEFILARHGKSPRGVDMAALQSALVDITSMK